MSSRSPANCPHDLRPGTTVCLHCMAAERQVARARMRRMVLRTMALGILAAGGTVAVTQVAVAMKERRVADATLVAEPVTEPATEPAAPTVQDGSPAPAAEPASAIPVVHVTTAPGAARGPLPPATALRPRLSEGRSTLGGGMTAERRGDTVTVDFDTELTRTRRAEKFERIVRATLPRVYGAPVEAALATVPEGGLVAGRDLLGDLPTRGMHLRLADGGTLSVWPATRPGRDGPLVVTYRVVAVAR